MALVIYKSTIVAGKDEPETNQLQGKTLASEIRDQFSSQEHQRRGVSVENFDSEDANTSHQPSSPPRETFKLCNTEALDFVGVGDNESSQLNDFGSL